MKLKGFWLPILVSLAMTPFLVLAGFLSAGAGHGSYFFTKILFPYTMLSTFSSGTITGPFMLLGVIQFPFYGLVLALGSRRRWLLLLLAGGLALVHISAAALAFFLTSEAFS